eukprot:6153447-Pleurochrysis_carterae.AAC.1
MDPEATSVPSSARVPGVLIGTRVRTSAHARTEGYEPYVGPAGGKLNKFLVYLRYLPRSGSKSLLARSNLTAYGKSWATFSEVTDADKAAF